MTLQTEPQGSPPMRSSTPPGISGTPQKARGELSWFERKIAGQPTSYVLATAEKGGRLYAFVVARPDGGWSWATRGVDGKGGVGGPHHDVEKARAEAETYVRLTPKLEPLS